MNLVTALLALATAAAAEDHEAIARCGAAHAADPAARIACLEDALRGHKPPLVPAPSAPPAPPAPPPPAIGQDQLEERERARSGKSAAATVKIVSASYDGSGAGTFRTAEGQVWRETELTPGRLHLKPGQEYSGRIERTALGGYRLYVDGVKWMMKVERLE